MFPLQKYLKLISALILRIKNVFTLTRKQRLITVYLNLIPAWYRLIKYGNPYLGYKNNGEAVSLFFLSLINLVSCTQGDLYLIGLKCIIVYF